MEWQRFLKEAFFSLKMLQKKGFDFFFLSYYKKKGCFFALFFGGEI